MLLAPAVPAGADDPLPTRAEIQALYPDLVNHYSFPPSGYTLRVPVADWMRLSVVTFGTPWDERAGHGMHTDPATLPAEELRLYRRTNPAGRAEYLAIEDVAAKPTNLFPVFHGTQAAFTFVDSVTEPRPESLTCRTVRGFLACRVIRPARGGVSYQTFAAAGGPAAMQPTDRQLRALFADQRSRWSFAAPDVTPWTLVVHWRRVAQIQFAAGTDELVAEPEIIDQIPKELRLFTRTVRGRSQVGLIEWADRSGIGGGELLNLFPDFAGDVHEWIFYDTNAIPGATYQETCRGLAKAGTDFLLCRTILQGEAVFYQTYVQI
jgi:hypothetical protein